MFLKGKIAISSGFFVSSRRYPAGLAALSQGVSTLKWRKRRRKCILRNLEIHSRTRQEEHGRKPESCSANRNQTRTFLISCKVKSRQAVKKAAQAGDFFVIIQTGDGRCWRKNRNSDRQSNWIVTIFRIIPHANKFRITYQAILSLCQQVSHYQILL